jgi:hypothetical protein
MFIYLSKKLKSSVTNPVPLNAVSWNREHGWLAIGGDEGEKAKKKKHRRRQKRRKQKRREESV